MPRRLGLPQGCIDVLMRVEFPLSQSERPSAVLKKGRYGEPLVH